MCQYKRIMLTATCASEKQISWIKYLEFLSFHRYNILNLHFSQKIKNIQLKTQHQQEINNILLTWS
jgi:hypothetical protein